jgi:hypothetical protein
MLSKIISTIDSPPEKHVTIANLLSTISQYSTIDSLLNTSRANKAIYKEWKIYIGQFKTQLLVVHNFFSQKAPLPETSEQSSIKASSQNSDEEFLYSEIKCKFTKNSKNLIQSLDRFGKENLALTSTNYTLAPGVLSNMQTMIDNADMSTKVIGIRTLNYLMKLFVVSNEESQSIQPDIFINAIVDIMKDPKSNSSDIEIELDNFLTIINKAPTQTSKNNKAYIDVLITCISDERITLKGIESAVKLFDTLCKSINRTNQTNDNSVRNGIIEKVTEVYRDDNSSPLTKKANLYALILLCRYDQILPDTLKYSIESLFKNLKNDGNLLTQPSDSAPLLNALSIIRSSTAPIVAPAAIPIIMNCLKHDKAPPSSKLQAITWLYNIMSSSPSSLSENSVISEMIDILYALITDKKSLTPTKQYAAILLTPYLSSNIPTKNSHLNSGIISELISLLNVDPKDPLRRNETLVTPYIDFNNYDHLSIKNNTAVILDYAKENGLTKEDQKSLMDLTQKIQNSSQNINPTSIYYKELLETYSYCMQMLDISSKKTNSELTVAKGLIKNLCTLNYNSEFFYLTLMFLNHFTDPNRPYATASLIPECSDEIIRTKCYENLFRAAEFTYPEQRKRYQLFSSIQKVLCNLSKKPEGMALINEKLSPEIKDDIKKSVEDQRLAKKKVTNDLITYYLKAAAIAAILIASSIMSYTAVAMISNYFSENNSPDL